MNCPIPLALCLCLLLAACHTAQTQSSIVVVPTDEMSREPAKPRDPVTRPAEPALPTPAAAPVQAISITGSQPEAPAKISYTSCNVAGPFLAMTFDDGPSAELTPKLLDILKQRDIKATFFVVGQNAAEYPDIMKRMVAEGHEVANHSWSHPSLTSLGAEGVRKQVQNTSDIIEKTTGTRPTLMRPPYGATSAALNKRFRDEYGLKVILWSVDPLDWKYRNSNRVMTSIVQGAHPGAIILSHDIHATTVAAMPATFDALLEKGYKFVTVSELIAMDRPQEVVKKEEPAPTMAR